MGRRYVAEGMGTSQEAADKWPRLFSKPALDGLGDLEDRGVKPGFPQEVAGRLIELACRSSPGTSRRSARTAGAEAGSSASSASSAWRAQGLKPRRWLSFRLPNDPASKARLRARSRCGCPLALLPRAGGVQALQRTLPGQPQGAAWIRTQASGRFHRRGANAALRFDGLPERQAEPASGSQARSLIRHRCIEAFSRRFRRAPEPGRRQRACRVQASDPGRGACLPGGGRRGYGLAAPAVRADPHSSEWLARPDGIGPGAGPGGIPAHRIQKEKSGIGEPGGKASTVSCRSQLVPIGSLWPCTLLNPWRMPSWPRGVLGCWSSEGGSGPGLGSLPDPRGLRGGENGSNGPCFPSVSLEDGLPYVCG